MKILDFIKRLRNHIYMRTIKVGTSVAVVDDEDFDAVSEISWWLHKDTSHPIGYAQGKGPDGKFWYMHRLVSERKDGPIPKGIIVDHENFDTLQNVRSNLRRVTHSESQYHKGMMGNNSSGFKGVSWDEFTKNWAVQVSHRGARVFYGRFKNLKDAAQVAVLQRFLHHGNFCKI